MWRRTWKTKLLKKSPFTLINCIKFFIFLQVDLHEAICTLRLCYCSSYNFIFIFFFWVIKKSKISTQLWSVSLVMGEMGMDNWESGIRVVSGTKLGRGFGDQNPPILEKLFNCAMVFERNVRKPCIQKNFKTSPWKISGYAPEWFDEGKDPQYLIIFCMEKRILAYFSF